MTDLYTDDDFSDVDGELSMDEDAWIAKMLA